MLIHLHAILVLVSIAAPILLAILAPAWRPRPARQVAMAAVPIAVVGVICLLLLSATGVPLTEWGFPLIGVIVAGLFARSQRVFQALRWSLLVLACFLCLNAMELRSNGYASAVVSKISEGTERVRLAALQSQLRKDFPAERMMPEQRMEKWNRKTLQSAWHTGFTGLYKVTVVPGEFWYPGGPVGVTSLEWRPRKDED